MAAQVAFSLDIASLSTAEVVFLVPLSISLAASLRKASLVFLMIAEHPYSFESFACAVLGKPGGGSETAWRDSFTGLRCQSKAAGLLGTL